MKNSLFGMTRKQFGLFVGIGIAAQGLLWLVIKY